MNRQRIDKWSVQDGRLSGQVAESDRARPITVSLSLVGRVPTASWLVKGDVVPTTAGEVELGDAA